LHPIFSDVAVDKSVAVDAWCTCHIAETQDEPRDKRQNGV